MRKSKCGSKDRFYLKLHANQHSAQKHFRVNNTVPVLRILKNNTDKKKKIKPQTTSKKLDYYLEE